MACARAHPPTTHTDIYIYIYIYIYLGHLVNRLPTKTDFIAGSHARIESHSWLLQKMLDPFSITHFGEPLAPVDKLWLSKQVLN